MPANSQKSINIAVSSRLYEHIEKLADNHDLISHTDEPNITATARAILHLFCTLDKMHGVRDLKDAKGMTLSDVIRHGVYREIDHFNSIEK